MAVQNQFINYVLDHKDSEIITNNSLNSEFFNSYVNEFNFIKEHINSYGVVPDKETFIDEFKDFTIVKVEEPAEFLLKKLYEERTEAIITESYISARNAIMKGDSSLAAQKLIDAATILASNKHIEATDILQETKQRYDAYIEKATGFDKFYIRTGFKELDDIIGGWDRQEELATIAARTNQGKSWILIRMAAEAIIQGLRVGFYSGEMSENKVAYRLDTQLSHISNTALIKGNISFQSTYKSYLDNLPTQYPGAVFKVLTPVKIGGPAGVNDLRAFIEKENLDILFVDQHSLLEDDRKAKNPVERASNISKDLKNLQVMKRIPIITASQQNRSSTENGIGTEHIAQSDRIAQDSTVILFFEQNKEQSMITLHLVKSRDSVHMKDLHYVFDFDKGKYTYVPEGADVDDDDDGCDPNYIPPNQEMDIF